MGNGLSAALGKDSLFEENRNVLEQLLRQLGANEYSQEQLDLANRCLKDEGLRVGARAFRSNRGISSLDLSSNHISSHGVELLCTAMHEQQELLTLNLSGNIEIGDEGCRHLAAFLAQNPKLEELSLFHCDITDDGVEALVNGLMYNNHLAVLRLDMNRLTDASLEMLFQLVTDRENATLGHITLSGNPGPMEESRLAALRAITKPARDAFVQKRELAAEEKQREHEIRQQHLAAAVREEEERKAAIEAAEREAAARAEQQHYEEELLRKQEAEQAVTAVSKNSTAKSRDEHAKREREMSERAIRQAYEWREQVTGHGSLVREWRDGFTVMQTKPGDMPGAVPSVVPEPPRRLKACWCDPHDVSAPYAKTLHYHCKYESQNRGMEDGEGAMGKYHGCRASGHTCATVGFYAKPLPDTSAAHFFASAHPATAM